MKENGKMLKEKKVKQKRDGTKTKNEGFLAEVFCGLK